MSQDLFSNGSNCFFFHCFSSWGVPPCHLAPFVTFWVLNPFQPGNSHCANPCLIGCPEGMQLLLVYLELTWSIQFDFETSSPRWGYPWTTRLASLHNRHRFLGRAYQAEGGIVVQWILTRPQLDFCSSFYSKTECMDSYRHRYSLPITQIVAIILQCGVLKSGK